MIDDSSPSIYVKPTGLAEKLLVLTIIFTIVSIIVIGLRVWIRLETKLFSLEDYLMCIGTVITIKDLISQLDLS